MTTVAFYREQAERERAAADAAGLDHVRSRHTRAADAWTVLADRLQNTTTLRAAREKPTGGTVSVSEPADEIAAN